MESISRLSTSETTPEDAFGLVINRMAFQGGDKDSTFLKNAGEFLINKTQSFDLLIFIRLPRGQLIRNIHCNTTLINFF